MSPTAVVTFGSRPTMFAFLLAQREHSCSTDASRSCTAVTVQEMLIKNFMTGLRLQRHFPNCLSLCHCWDGWFMVGSWRCPRSVCENVAPLAPFPSFFVFSHGGVFYPFPLFFSLLRPCRSARVTPNPKHRKCTAEDSTERQRRRWPRARRRESRRSRERPGQRCQQQCQSCEDNNLLVGPYLAGTTWEQRSSR